MREITPWEELKGAPLNQIESICGFLDAVKPNPDGTMEALFKKAGPLVAAELRKWLAVQEGKAKKTPKSTKPKETDPNWAIAKGMVTEFGDIYSKAMNAPMPRKSTFPYDLKLIRELLDSGYSDDYIRSMYDRFIACGQNIDTYPNGSIFRNGTIFDFKNNFGQLIAAGKGEEKSKINEHRVPVGMKGVGV